MASERSKRRDLLTCILIILYIISFQNLNNIKEYSLVNIEFQTNICEVSFIWYFTLNEKQQHWKGGGVLSIMPKIPEIWLAIKWKGLV